MRPIVSLLVLLGLALCSIAQEPEKKPEGDPGKAGGDPKAAPEPKEAPAWVMPAKDAKKLAGLLRDYLLPGKKVRRDVQVKLSKFLDRPIGGHSALEDVAGIVEILKRTRNFNSKIGRPGKISEHAIRPKVHGFPGGIGTVTYLIYLPKNYDPRKHLSPLLFCLPDNKVWLDGKSYIEEVWTKRSENVRDDFVVVVPRPQAKGDRWSNAKSYARAMIALRHVLGTFDVGKKVAGPAVDPTRVFIDGQDSAALVAGRFPEVFNGAILRNSDGRSLSRTNLRVAGGLSLLPAYCIFNGKKKMQQQFAEKLRAMNDKSLLVAAEAGDDKFMGDAVALTSWMEARFDRNTQPRKIEYTIHEPSFQRHYWINALEFDASVKPAPSFFAEADRAKNEVRVEVNGLTRFELFLNDAIVDLNKNLRIVVVEGTKEFELFNDKKARDLGVLLEELVASNCAWRVYPVKFTVNVPLLRERQAKLDAEKAAQEAEKDAGKKGTGADPAVGKGE